MISRINLLGHPKRKRTSRRWCRPAGRRGWNFLGILLAFLVLAIGLNAFTTSTSPIAPKIWPPAEDRRRRCPEIRQRAARL